MLTKDDLAKIQEIVRDTVREEIGTESKSLKEDFVGEIKLARIEIQKDIRSLTDRVKNLEIATSKIQKDIKVITSFFDSEHLKLRKRVEKIEEHLGLSPTL